MPRPMKPGSVSRRSVLGGAAAAPFLLAGCETSPDPAAGPTVRSLAWANSLTDHPLPPERLATILPAFRMNHAFFRAVRELDIPDLVEPGVMFVARGPEDAGA